VQSNFVIRDLIAQPGEKKSGRLHIGNKAASEYSLPITIINGVDDGPILAIISGQHGTQYTGIAASLEIMQRIDPKKLAGAVIVVPIVNVLGFEQRARLAFPLEDDFSGTKDLNRIWPGNRNRSLAHITIHDLFTEVVSRAQYLLDLRGGDGYEFLSPSSVMITMVGNKEVDEKTRTLAEVVGYDLIFEASLSSTPTEAQSNVRTGVSLLPINYGDERGRSQTEPPLVGIPTVVLENGDQGILKHELVENTITGVTNVLKYLDMIEGIAAPRKDCKRISDAIQIRCKTGGLFLQKIKTGANVEEGDRIGEVLSVDGSVEEVVATKSGLLLESFCNPAVNTGDILAEIVTIT
jgi:predicted deacylase